MKNLQGLSKFVQFVSGKMITFNLMTLIMRGGANEESLNEAQKNFKEIGASSGKHIKHVRNPRIDERGGVLNNSMQVLRQNKHCWWLLDNRWKNCHIFGLNNEI